MFEIDGKKYEVKKQELHGRRCQGCAFELDDWPCAHAPTCIYVEFGFIVQLVFVEVGDEKQSN